MSIEQVSSLDDGKWGGEALTAVAKYFPLLAIDFFPLYTKRKRNKERKREKERKKIERKSNTVKPMQSKRQLRH